MTGLVTEKVTGLVTQQVNQRLVSCRSATTVCHRRAFEKLGSFKNSQLFCWILVNALLTVCYYQDTYVGTVWHCTVSYRTAPLPSEARRCSER